MNAYDLLNLIINFLYETFGEHTNESKKKLVNKNANKKYVYDNKNEDVL